MGRGFCALGYGERCLKTGFVEVSDLAEDGRDLCVSWSRDDVLPWFSVEWPIPRAMFVPLEPEFPNNNFSPSFTGSLFLSFFYLFSFPHFLHLFCREETG